jgi:hypothetical protein
MNRSRRILYRRNAIVRMGASTVCDQHRRWPIDWLTVKEAFHFWPTSLRNASNFVAHGLFGFCGGAGAFWVSAISLLITICSRRIRTSVAQGFVFRELRRRAGGDD